LREILLHLHGDILQNTPPKSVSDEKKKWFYVTDDISFGFHVPYTVKSPLQCSRLKQCQPKHRRKKNAMRSQYQAVIMDKNTISYYLNRGYIDIGLCAVAVSRNLVG